MTVGPRSFPNQKPVADPFKPPLKFIKCAPLTLVYIHELVYVLAIFPSDIKYTNRMTHSL